MKRLDLSNGGPRLSWFTSPKTFPINLGNSFASYEGPAQGVSSGPPGMAVSPYTSPVAPQNTLPVRALFDGANRVTF